MEFNCGSN